MEFIKKNSHSSNLNSTSGTKTPKEEERQPENQADRNVMETIIQVSDELTQTRNVSKTGDHSLAKENTLKDNFTI
jgi:hypothetical protein